MNISTFEQLPVDKPPEDITGLEQFVDRQQVEAVARQMIVVRHMLPSAEVRQPERLDNARTALMEAMTASGHLSVVKIHGTPEEVNHQVLSRLLNGWNDNLPEHEKNRRFAELCNELIIQKMFGASLRGELPPDIEICEISDYPEALRGYRLGYRDSNRKGMVRSSSLISHGDGNFTRVIETISRSNATASSTFSFLESCSVSVDSKAADLAALEAPFVYKRHQLSEGVIEIMRRLDRSSGLGVRYGDRNERLSRHVPYEALREESARRENEIEVYIEHLANLEQQLDQKIEQGEETQSGKETTLREQVEAALNAICTLEPNYAAETFGEAAVEMFEQAATLEAMGLHEEARSLIESNGYLKEMITFCGTTIPVKEAQAMGLKVSSFGELLDIGKNSWKWKQGICVVKSCPTRPKKTEVGPCSVCRNCQHKFDKGVDPTKESALPFSLLFFKKTAEKAAA